ncbi:MAG: gamma-glutamyltransferase [Chloroflexota bacterium]
MPFDLEDLNTTSNTRKPIFARNVVATSQPLAAQAGLEILRRGGNAVDAAIATAVTLTVVEPCSNGIGGDCFALVWHNDKLHGLNASGRAPLLHTLDRFAGMPEMPERGWLSVTVPGAVMGWRDLHRKFGKLAFATLFEPAIRYAENGFPISATVYHGWNSSVLNRLPQLTGDEYAGYRATFTIDGRAPFIGEIFRNPDQAQTLRRIAETEGEAFYTGEIAEDIQDFAKKTGGLLRASDLAAHHSEWVEPIRVNYRGYDVWEIPPNGQGIAALMALNILEGYDLSAMPRESLEAYHLQIEAMKLATADAWRYVCDPEHAAIPIDGLLSKEYATERRKLITQRALFPTPGQPPSSDTVYLCTADADGMMVSFIQSNYGGFGSYIVPPGTGVALQNRGNGFVLDPSHPNVIAPGKRPFHTIIPGFMTRDGQAFGPFGVMGGRMQPAGHVQMVLNTVEWGMHPQASLDAARWFWWEDNYTKLEPGVPSDIVQALRQRGHDIEVDTELDAFGRGQIIWRLPSGAYIAGSDNRTDGCAAGY